MKTCRLELSVELGTLQLGSSIDEFGGIKTEHDMNLIAHSFGDQVAWLRNHPSIIAWFTVPTAFRAPSWNSAISTSSRNLDDRPYIGAAKQKKASLQDTRRKMAGPYEYVAPNYWYTTPKAPGECVRLQHRDRHRRSGAAEGISYTVCLAMPYGPRRSMELSLHDCHRRHEQTRCSHRHHQ